MIVLENVATTTTNMGLLDFSSGPSPTNNRIGISSKSKVDRATWNKPGCRKIRCSQTSLKKKATQLPQNTTIVKVMRENDSSTHPIMETRSFTSKSSWWFLRWNMYFVRFWEVSKGIWRAWSVNFFRRLKVLFWPYVGLV